MLSVHLICVGKLKEKFYLAACAEYQKRLGAYCRLELTELPEERLPQNPSRAQIAAALEKVISAKHRDMLDVNRKALEMGAEAK